MIARRLGVLTLLLGCSCGSGDASSSETDSDGSSSTANVSAATTAVATTDPDTSSTSGSSGTTAEATSSVTGTSTTASTTSADTGTESGSDGSSTGELPPVGSPGCKAAEQLAEGEHALTLDGFDRRYIVRLPQNYTSAQPWPLIFALHGNGGNPDYWDGLGNERDIRTAFADEAIIIIPEAINNAWRDYDAAPDTWPAGIVLELNFFDAVYETAQNELCIDTTNVFSMGFSGGGSFSGVLGCQRDYIRAIAVGGSVVYFEEADCVETPATWITIGDQELEAGRVAFRDFFVEHAGCEATSMPGSPAGCVDYDGCGDGTPVTFCSHAAGHVWPSIGTDATKAFFQGFYAP